MKFPLFTPVVLLRDYPTYQLYRGHILTVVEHHPMTEGEDGYSLEFETGDTIEVSESEIKAPN